MPIDSAHSSRWEIAEVVFGVPLLFAIVLQFFVPFSLPRESFRLAFVVVGIVLVILGLGVITLARREFAQQDQPTDPGHPTTRLVTTGVFSVSRNPLYLGAAFFLVGIAMAVNLPWVLVLLLPSMVLCHYVLIAPEERYLTAKFGVEYQIYVAKVHRWIGRHSVRS